MACQYSEQQILGQLMSMTSGTTNQWRWDAWWIVYDHPDEGIPPLAPATINAMSLPQVANALYRCYCLKDCPGDL